MGILHIQMFTNKIYYIVITSVVLWPIYQNISYIYRFFISKKNASTQTDTNTQNTQYETNINDYIIIEYCPRV